MVRVAGPSQPCGLPLWQASGMPWLCCRRTTSDQMPDLPAFDQIQVQGPETLFAQAEQLQLDLLRPLHRQEDRIRLRLPRP